MVADLMPARNFSSALLKRACGNVAVLQVEDVRWSDWGRAERIVQTLRDIGKPAVSGWPPQVADAEPLFDLRGRARCGLDSWFHALSGDGRFVLGGST